MKCEDDQEDTKGKTGGLLIVMEIELEAKINPCHCNNGRKRKERGAKAHNQK